MKSCFDVRLLASADHAYGLLYNGACVTVNDRGYVVLRDLANKGATIGYISVGTAATNSLEVQVRLVPEHYREAEADLLTKLAVKTMADFYKAKGLKDPNTHLAKYIHNLYYCDDEREIQDITPEA